MNFTFRGSVFLLIAAMLMACTDRGALNREAEAARTQRLIGTWDARFYIDRPLVVGSDAESMKQEVHGQLALLANRSVSQAYPLMESPSAYGAFDVDFTPFGFDARSDDETPVAAAGWLSLDTLEIILCHEGKPYLRVASFYIPSNDLMETCGAHVGSCSKSPGGLPPHRCHGA